MKVILRERTGYIYVSRPCIELGNIYTAWPWIESENTHISRQSYLIYYNNCCKKYLFAAYLFTNKMFRVGENPSIKITGIKSSKKW